MKRAIPLALCAFVIVSCVSGCAVVNMGEWGTSAVTVRGTGDLESYEIKTGDYSKIDIRGLCEVRYYAAASDTVTLEIQANLKEYYNIEVRGDELVVGPKEGYGIRTNKTPVLTVSTPVLNRLNISGAGTFTTYDTIIADSFTLKLSGAGKGKADFDVDSFTIDVSGAGDFTLSGKADTADFEASGAADLDASALQTRKAKVRFSGAGTMKVNCSEELYVNASGVGTVEYSGSPGVVDLNKSGMVSVTQVN